MSRQTIEKEPTTYKGLTNPTDDLHARSQFVRLRLALGITIDFSARGGTSPILLRSELLKLSPVELEPV